VTPAESADGRGKRLHSDRYTPLGLRRESTP
jgi:hypothetical protein